MKRLALILVLLMPAVAKAEPPVTGLIIDASRLDLKRSRFPKIYSPDAVMLYPPSSLFDNPDYMQGYVGFMPSVAEALKQTDRIGEHPWVVQPPQLHEADPTQGSVDLSESQATRLEALEAERHLLAEDRVLIVIGLAVVETSPAAGDAAVPADAVVRIRFSKPLREDQRGLLTAWHLAAEGETPLAGSVTADARAGTLTFTPNRPFTPGERYEVRVPATVEAATLAPLGTEFRLAFTIQKPPPPTDPDAPADTPDEAAEPG